MSPPKFQPRSALRLRRGVRQLHRWLGLLIAVQLSLWVTGGLVMSALRLEAVRGETMAAPSAPLALTAATPLRPLTEVLAEQREHGPFQAVALRSWLGEPVYWLQGANGTLMLDAATGRALAPLDEAQARRVALADYAGPGRLLGLDWVTEGGTEYRGRPLPLWRARFDDARDTTLYIAPDTGQVVARRNDLWRVFDFFWMLHIMDYEEREDFNHPLLVTTAATALLFILTGVGMLFYSFRPTRQRLAARG